MSTYVEAVGRSEAEKNQHSHLYFVGENGYWPMCIYGWNRSDGERLSIWRGWRGGRGLCKICERRKEQGLPPIKEAHHKTKLL